MNERPAAETAAGSFFVVSLREPPPRDVRCACGAFGDSPPPSTAPKPPPPPSICWGFFSTVGRGLAPAVFPGYRVVEGVDPYRWSRGPSGY